MSYCSVSVVIHCGMNKHDLINNTDTGDIFSLPVSFKESPLLMGVILREFQLNALLSYSAEAKECINISYLYISVRNHVMYRYE